MNKDILLQILKDNCPYAKASILDGIAESCHLFDEYEINTDNRLAMCLAQLAHESAGFRTTREYASGSAYEGREDLGNIYEGDGTRYRGRGLIQLTGRANYKKYGDILGVDIEEDPLSVEAFPLALHVSLEYWKNRNLNAYADIDDFRQITRRINGGYNGYEDRVQWLNKFRQAIANNSPLSN